MSITIITHDIPCPKCGRPINGHTSMSGDRIPEIGDLTICAWCAAILEYSEDMTLRVFPDEKLRALAKSQPQEFAILLEGQQFFREQHRNKPN